MRIIPLTALGAAFLLPACSVLQSTPQPAAYAAPEPEPHMLVTPPERLTVVELLEILEHLPSNGAPMPAGSGEVEVDRLAVQAFYEKLQAEPSADGRARMLVEQSLDRTAPVERWNQVREFKSRERCETTKSELQDITRDAIADVDYYHGMPMYELQWVLLEWSNRWAQCVPVEDLPLKS